MKRCSKFKISICLAVAVTLLSGSTVALADEGIEKGYTYNYDFWKEIQYSPDPYAVVGVYTAGDLGLDVKFKNPDGLYVKNNMVYVCDTGNNRIIQWERHEDDSFELIRIIDTIAGDEEKPNLSGPTDIFVTDEGIIYICDKGNERILKLDNTLKVIREYNRPTEATFDASLSYLPDKLVVDSEGRVYCISDYVNKGIIKYETDGSFSGFYGATPAKYDFTKYVYKRFIATEAQRAKMENFVPTEYDNIALDSEGFIFATTTSVTAGGLNSGSDQPVRRLNLLGNNILIQNGYDNVIGDYSFGNYAGYNGPSLFIDVTILDNDVYFCLDKTRGRLFSYDQQGNLLYIFGGVGNIDGYFKNPVAVDHMGEDLIVLDSSDESLTVFTPTEYGKLIFKALREYDEGDYIASGETWKAVKDINGNYDQAYIGIGRSLLRQKKYKEAMPYFKTKWAVKQYTKAFKRYRKQWIEENIGWIFTVILLAVLIPNLTKRIKFIKYQIDTADIFKPSRNQETK